MEGVVQGILFAESSIATNAETVEQRGEGRVEGVALGCTNLACLLMGKCTRIMCFFIDWL